MKNHYEVCIVGGGPKGLALGTELQQENINFLLLDKHGPGWSWHPENMNPRVTLHPAGWEITNRPELSFETFWNASYSETEKRRHPLHHGSFTAWHMRAYLKWLGKMQPLVKGDLTQMQYAAADGLRLGIRDKDKTYQECTTRCIVLATGLTGFGGSEFVYDPTGLRGSSPLVMHTPADLRTNREVAEFIGESRSVAIIGAGNSGTGVFFQLESLTALQEIHLISNTGFEESMKEVPFHHSDDGELVSAIPPQNWARAVRESRIRRHEHIGVLDGRQEGDRVVLITTGGDLYVDKVILASGYSYDANRLPFMVELVRSNIVSLTDTKRHLRLDKNHRAVSLDSNIALYVLGAGAETLSKNERWLFSTKETIKTLREDILRAL